MWRLATSVGFDYALVGANNQVSNTWEMLAIIHLNFINCMAKLHTFILAINVK